MIIGLFLTALLEIFDAFAYFVFPLIPPTVLTVMSTIFAYLTNALNWVFSFIDKNYVLNLLGWWLTFGGVVLTYELLYSLWQLVTGNGHNSHAVFETADGQTADNLARTFRSKH